MKRKDFTLNICYLIICVVKIGDSKILKRRCTLKSAYTETVYYVL